MNSEVGKLRKVLVCAPGLAHTRLTPSNCHDLLFDDVMWVQNAQRDHFDFVAKMRARGVEVLELHNVLTETMDNSEARAWLLDGGVTLNPLYWPARHDATLLMKAIYQFHPEFVGATALWGDPEMDWGFATLEGGDVEVPGNGVVLIGMSERSSRQAITQVAAKLFAEGAAEQVIVAGMPKLRAAMHLRE